VVAPLGKSAFPVDPSIDGRTSSANDTGGQATVARFLCARQPMRRDSLYLK
jgi:hypothetical protein